MSRRLPNPSPDSLPLPRPFSNEGGDISPDLLAAYASQPDSIWPSYSGSQVPSPQPPPPTRYNPQRRPRHSAPIPDTSSPGHHASRLSWCSVRSEPGASVPATDPSTLHRRPVNGMASAPSHCTPLPSSGLFGPTPSTSSVATARYVTPLRANEVANSRRSRNTATHWVDGTSADQENDQVEILDEPPSFDHSTPHPTPQPTVFDREQYERAQATFRNNPWAPFGQSLYSPPESVVDLDPEESFSKICALLEERDRKNPPNPAAVHLLLNPEGEIPRCTYVDVNSAEYNVHLNPSQMYDDRDFMLPATATRDTTVRIVIDWPFQLVVSPAHGPTRPVFDMNVTHDDDRFGEDVVSVDDVWHAIYACLRRPVDREQYYSYDTDARKAIRTAFERRCKRWPGNLRENGLLQIDLLGGKNQFVGLVYHEVDGEACWQACFLRGKP